ncbi:MAG: HNH endonuclease [Gemmatimonadaceae bacterium]
MPVCHWFAVVAGIPAHRNLAQAAMLRIPLCNTKGCFALADDTDSFLLNWKWRVHPDGYAETSIGGARVFMHSMLIAVPRGRVVDHRNRDRTDNRRENLRSASASENAANRGRRRNANEPFVGVRQTASGRWQARVGERGRHLGVFDTAEEAARARDEAARGEYGDFATLNFSPNVERSVNARPPLAVPRQRSERPSGNRKANLKDGGETRTRAKRAAASKRIK